MQAHQKQQHAQVVLPFQISQLDKRNLISTDLLGGFCCFQQTLSTTSLTEAPFGSCTAPPVSVLMLFSYSQTGKIMIIVLPSRVAKNNHISSRVSRLACKTYYFENTASVNVQVQILPIHAHTSNFIWPWSSVEKNEITYRHTAVELYTSHFKK